MSLVVMTKNFKVLVSKNSLPFVLGILTSVLLGIDTAIFVVFGLIVYYLLIGRST